MDCGKIRCAGTSWPVLLRRGWPVLCVHALFVNDMGIGAQACTVWDLILYSTSGFACIVAVTQACMVQVVLLVQ